MVISKLTSSSQKIRQLVFTTRAVRQLCQLTLLGERIRAEMEGGGNGEYVILLQNETLKIKNKTTPVANLPEEA